MHTEDIRTGRPTWQTLMTSSLALLVSFGLASAGCHNGNDGAAADKPGATDELHSAERGAAAENDAGETGRDRIREPARPTRDEMALHTAVATGNAEAIRRLVGQGVDIHAFNDDQVTPLHTAARIGQVDSMQLLIDLGANVNAKGRLDVTPLLWAVRTHQIDAVHILLENGADPNIRAGYEADISPLELAQRRGMQEIAELLIEFDAVP